MASSGMSIIAEELTKRYGTTAVLDRVSEDGWTLRPTGNRAATVLRDTWTITRRDLGHWVAQPALVVISLLFPVMTVLMFGYLFGGALSVPGGGNYREFLLPGMFTLTMVFGIEMIMVVVVTDAHRGITDRFRSLPMSSWRCCWAAAAPTCAMPSPDWR